MSGIQREFHRQMAEARTHLDSGENVTAAVFGAYDSRMLGHATLRNGVFVATDRRLIFFGLRSFSGYDLESFPYENISSIEASKGLLGQTITFFASGNRASLKFIKRDGGDVQRFIQVVRDASARQKHQSVSVPVDAADQIRKLAALRDEGIVSEDEFQAKKRQLLLP